MPWKYSEAYEIGMAGTAGITAAPFCIMGKYYGYEDMKDTVCNLYQAIVVVRAPSGRIAPRAPPALPRPPLWRGGQQAPRLGAASCLRC